MSGPFRPPSPAGWQIVPYEGKTTFKRMRVRDHARIRDVLRHLQSHDCVALIGPPFSEKTALLRDVAAALPAGGLYRPLYLDLWQANSEDESGFFTSLAGLIDRALAALPPVPAPGDAHGIANAGQRRRTDGSTAVSEDYPSSGHPASGSVAPAPYFPLPAARVPTAHAFQTFLGGCADAQPAHLVLLIDHLQALPHDLVHSLLLALRAAYMERPVDASRQLMAVVAGSMNLVGLSAGATSPFNVARPVLAGPLSEAQTTALAAATLEAQGCVASPGALARICHWTVGDHYLIPHLCGWAAETVQGYRRTLVDRRVVDRAAQRLLSDERGLAPVHEAIRLIEEDPDTVLDVLHLLQHETLPRSRAHQLPTRTGADRLQLSGAVVLSDGRYVLKNEVYRQGLARHFTTERVGHILRIAGRWQEAIAYLAPQVGGESSGSTAGPVVTVAVASDAAQAQLLEATVQSIYACDSLGRACELLARGLQQGFGLAEVAIYQALPAQARLERVYPAPRDEAQAGKAISLLDPESVEARAYAYGHYALRGSGDDARLVVALDAGARRLGVVTIERYGRGHGPHELPRQLPDLLHFLGHAGLAIAEVVIRAAHREIGQDVLEAGTVQPTLNRVLETISQGLGCDAASLYLIGPREETSGEVLRMVAGIGQSWSPEWQAQARVDLAGEHPAAVCLRTGRQLVAAGSDDRFNHALMARFGLDRYSWVYLPLSAAGRPLGTLELGYGEARHFLPGSEGQADLAAFANQVAIAVHNMQLLRRTDEALARRVTELEKLRSSSLALSATLDVATILDRIIRDVRALFPGSETTVWEYDEAAGSLRVLRSSLADPAYLAQRPSAGSVTHRAATTGQLQEVANLAARPGAADDPAVRLGLRGLMAVPLISRDRVLGAINLYAYGSSRGGEALGRLATDDPSVAQAWQAPGPAAGAGAAELLQAFAAHAAVAIENARLHMEEMQQQRLAQELAVARSIQRSMLPTTTPDLPGWEFAAIYRSARVVGGDFYDFYDLPGEPPQSGILIADVTDKGIPAALFMALSRTVIRAMALSGLSPAAALAKANNLILNDSRSDLALTAVYALLNPASGRLTYANGGHNRPLWLQAAAGTVVELTARGIILGAFDAVELEERQIDLGPGDVLVFYTDGITDAINLDDELYGDERLGALLAAHAGDSAQVILDAIMAEVAIFAGGAEQADDITCVIVRRTA